ncbi:MAG: cyclic nucleotide-binding domain-containing protein [Archangium sp.]|nr:cyclic nucleotide-binding domain-containing protein [Archangium sp.]
MAEYSSEFDFVEDDSGGRFVTVGGPLLQLRAHLSRGDIDAAVALYEESAGAARDGLIEEAKSASFELKKAISLMLVKARDFAGAGLVFELARLENEAAKNYEQAGSWAPAAACYERSGELLKAAVCFERAGKVSRAIELYQSAGAKEPLAECLARQRRFDEAAVIYQGLGNTHAEVEVLRAAVQGRLGGLGTVKRLAQLMVQYGHAPKAADLLMDTVRNVAEARRDRSFLELVAQGLEVTNRPDAAAKVRNKIGLLSAPGLESAPPTPTLVAAASKPTPEGYGFLKALPMFAELSLPDMKVLYRSCSELQFAAGEHLVDIGQPGKGLFVIVDGMVEVYGGPDAGSRLLNTMGPGAHVGEISLLRDTPTSARVTARTAVKTLFVSRGAFTDYLANNPAAALCIYRLFTQNLADRVRALSAAR